VFKVSGTYQSEKVPPRRPANSTRRRLRDGLEHLLAEKRRPRGDQPRRLVPVQPRRTNHVRVGPGVIEFRMKGRTQTCRTEELDLDKLTIANGTVNFQRKDARVGWFSSDGVFAFEYANLANAHLFLFLLKRLVLGVSEPETGVRTNFRHWRAGLRQRPEWRHAAETSAPPA